MLGMAGNKWKRWLSQLISGISLAAVITSCSASSSEVRSQLSNVTQDAVLNDLDQALQEPAVALELGRIETGNLTSTDPVLLMRGRSAEGVRSPSGVDTVESSAEYRTYFDLYRVTVDKPGDYDVTVVPKAGNAWIVQPIIVPVIRVLTPTGELLATEESVRTWEDRPVRRAVVHLSASGDCFVLVGSDNSSPGRVAGHDRELLPATFSGGTFTPGATIEAPLASCGAGKYTVEMKQIERR